MSETSISHQYDKIQNDLKAGHRASYLLGPELKLEILSALNTTDEKMQIKVFCLLAHCQKPDLDLSFELEKIEVDKLGSSDLKIFYLESLRAHHLRHFQTSGSMNFKQSPKQIIKLLKDKDPEVIMHALSIVEDFGSLIKRQYSKEIYLTKPSLWRALISSKMRQIRKYHKALDYI